MRWDSDHVILLNDDIQAMANELPGIDPGRAAAMRVRLFRVRIPSAHTPDQGGRGKCRGLAWPPT